MDNDSCLLLSQRLHRPVINALNSSLKTKSLVDYPMYPPMGLHPDETSAKLVKEKKTDRVLNYSIEEEKQTHSLEQPPKQSQD